VDLGSSLEELSTPLLLMRLSYPLSLSLMWLPEGLRRSKVISTATCHRAAGILNLIQNQSTSAISAGSERPEEVIVHHMCTSTQRCCTCGAKSFRRYYRTGVMTLRFFMTLRSATSASSSMPMQGHNPSNRSTRVCHRSPLNVIALLIDRSREIQGCVGNTNFVICIESQQILRGLPEVHRIQFKNDKHAT
jgi:hypothetical protein